MVNLESAVASQMCRCIFYFKMLITIHSTTFCYVHKKYSFMCFDKVWVLTMSTKQLWSPRNSTVCHTTELFLFFELSSYQRLFFSGCAFAIKDPVTRWKSPYVLKLDQCSFYSQLFLELSIMQMMQNDKQEKCKNCVLSLGGTSINTVSTHACISYKLLVNSLNLIPKIEYISDN